MTLLDLLPSMHSAMSARLDHAFWPSETHYDSSGRITVGRVALQDIADQFGTPTHVIDEDDVRHRCRAYRKIFPEADIAYAAAALPIRAVVRWVTEEGLSIGIGSTSELAIALSAGVDPKRIILHCNAMTAEEAQSAAAIGAGRTVVDSLACIAHVSAATRNSQNVLIQVQPDARHCNESDDAIRAAVRQSNLNLVGLHCHLGSHSSDTDRIASTIHELVTQLDLVRREHGTVLTELVLGGDRSVSPTPNGTSVHLPGLAATIDDALDSACATYRFPRPRITLEPGRAIVASAGVILHRVVSVVGVGDGRTVVAVEGGRNADPSSPVATVALANRHPTGPVMTATLVGSRDEPQQGVVVTLPADVHPGEVLAVAGAGDLRNGFATTTSVGRPPIVAVQHGRTTQLVRRETIADLMARDAD
ncbi:diaminopimelate decarboxylase [Antrihabitans sp. YC3-6]|uniref:Diaminopimelate decarboxylase n=1 Tax=Antrihabitans stalagmiti TaxID=2799499 RepID=A0A934U6Y3_9NOCA|nr:diaminopimelate decarboxylase [Antrihabitans stalagmiti]MBJ8342423.1 diaminopimelate decarboxylase [Antrihabitans stalagmiti]